MGQMPFAMGGLVDYDNVVKSKYQIKPKYIVILAIVVIAFFTVLNVVA